MIVLVLVAGIVIAGLFFAGVLGTLIGGLAAMRVKHLERKYPDQPSHVRLLESHEVTAEDLEGWDGEDELEI